MAPGVCTSGAHSCTTSRKPRGVGWQRTNQRAREGNKRLWWFQRERKKSSLQGKKQPRIRGDNLCPEIFLPTDSTPKFFWRTAYYSGSKIVAQIGFAQSQAPFPPSKHPVPRRSNPFLSQPIILVFGHLHLCSCIVWRNTCLLFLFLFLAVPPSSCLLVLRSLLLLVVYL